MNRLSTFQIKKLQSTDLTLAQELIKVWSVDDGIKNHKIPSDKYLHQLLSKKDFHVYVVLADEEVAGGLTAYELQLFDTEIKELFLYEIGIIEKYRRRGMATQLIETLKLFCLEKNIKVIFLGTEMENEAAKKLYETTGADLEIIPWYTYNLPIKK